MIVLSVRKWSLYLLWKYLRAYVCVWKSFLAFVENRRMSAQLRRARQQFETCWGTMLRIARKQSENDLRCVCELFGNIWGSFFKVYEISELCENCWELLKILGYCVRIFWCYLQKQPESGIINSYTLFWNHCLRIVLLRLGIDLRPFWNRVERRNIWD